MKVKAQHAIRLLTLPYALVAKPHGVDGLFFNMKYICIAEG